MVRVSNSFDNLPVNSGICLLYAVQCELDSVATYVESSATIGGNRGAIFRPETNHNVAGYNKINWTNRMYTLPGLQVYF